MKIKTEWSVDHFRADCLDLPGSPPVGLGATKELAIACLFWRMQFETAGGRGGSWMDYLKKTDPIEVDETVWSWPESYKNS